MKAEDNPFPSLLFVEGSTPATPGTGNARLFVDSADGLLKWVDDAGVVHDAGGAGGGGSVTWTAVSSFSNGWVNFGGGEPVAAYAKDSAGIVHLRGLIKSGTLGLTAFQLPAGYRPSSSGSYATAGANSGGTSNVFSPCKVTALGEVQPGPISNAWQWLHGVSFIAEA